MFQAERAGEDSRASPAAVIAFTTNSFSSRQSAAKVVWDVATNPPLPLRERAGVRGIARA